MKRREFITLVGSAAAGAGRLERVRTSWTPIARAISRAML
jgi:hypothetical protein